MPLPTKTQRRRRYEIPSEEIAACALLWTLDAIDEADPTGTVLSDALGVELMHVHQEMMNGCSGEDYLPPLPRKMDA